MQSNFADGKKPIQFSARNIGLEKSKRDLSICFEESLHYSFFFLIFFGNYIYIFCAILLFP